MLPLCSSAHNSLSHRSRVHRLLASASALRERQTRREAGAQSLRTSHQEVAGLPNSDGGATMLRPQRG
jgi:hypothetical protein